MSGPLSGIRVISPDICRLRVTRQRRFSGDMGAEVIKVEGPEGDTTRYTGPARSSDMAASVLGSQQKQAFART